MVKTTVSVIKADVGSLAGHNRPHPRMLELCAERLAGGVKAGTISDFHVTKCGDDINLVMTHGKGEDNPGVHRLAWEAFLSATEFAKKHHLYGAGQDLLSDAFSGNVRGLGPGAAEVTFEERKSEPLIVFMADKTDPSAFSLPLARVFLDPFSTSGLVIDPRLHEGFRFEIFDLVDNKKITLSAPEETYDILTLIGDITRYAIKRVHSRDPAIGTACTVSTEKLSFMAGQYVGKDDPVAVCRAQAGLPAVGEVLQPFAHPGLVAGWMRGSHMGAWYPCSVEDAIPSYFDGPPRLCAIGLVVADGKLVGLEDPEKAKVGGHIPVDLFADTCWDVVRKQSMEVSLYIRRHGPFMPAILPPEEMEYTTKPAVLKKLLPRFQALDKLEAAGTTKIEKKQ